MRFRTVYSAREESPIDKKAMVFRDDSMTDQRYKDDADVNLILAKYRVTGNKGLLGLHPNGQPIIPPRYEDCGNIGDYMECLEVVQDAQDKFDALPANVRKAVGNTPAGMLEFISNPNNYERGVELGIFEKRVEVMDNVGNSNIIDNTSSVVLPNDVGTLSEVTPQ